MLRTDAVLWTLEMPSTTRRLLFARRGWPASRLDLARMRMEHVEVVISRAVNLYLAVENASF